MILFFEGQLGCMYMTLTSVFAGSGGNIEVDCAFLGYIGEKKREERGD